MADEEFKTVLKIEGDAAGAIAAVRQAKAEHAQLAAQVEAENAAMAASAAKEQSSRDELATMRAASELGRRNAADQARLEQDRARAAQAAASAREQAARDEWRTMQASAELGRRNQADQAAGGGRGFQRVQGLAQLMGLINPVVGMFTSLGTHVVASVSDMWNKSKPFLENLANAAPALFAIGATALITAAKAFCDAMIEQAHKFQEEQQRIKAGALELQAAVREELGKRGIAGDEATASARAKAAQLERFGFDRGTAVQAAAVGVQQGLGDEQLIQLAAGLKAGQVDTGGSKAQVGRKLDLFYKGTLARPESAQVNAAVVQQAIATREDVVGEELQKQRKEIQDTQKSIWDMSAGEIASRIAGGRRDYDEMAPRQAELDTLAGQRQAAAARAAPKPATRPAPTGPAGGGAYSVIINSWGVMNLSKQGLDAKVQRAEAM